MQFYRRWIWPGVSLVLLMLVAGLWYSYNRTKETLEATHKELEHRLFELDRSRQSADAARAEAQAAAEREETARKWGALAESRAEQSEAARLKAETESEQAQKLAKSAVARSREAREELDRLRTRREEELRKMQKALSRIAPTRRTPLGLVVDLGSDSLRFDFDKAVIRPENREMLSRIAGVLLASEGYRLFIYGHTDDIGTDEYNQNLSERRAKAVADYLEKAGIPAGLMDTKGFGKSSPREKQATRAAREKNRRVEIGIVDTILSYEPPPASSSAK